MTLGIQVPGQVMDEVNQRKDKILQSEQEAKNQNNEKAFMPKPNKPPVVNHQLPQHTYTTQATQHHTTSQHLPHNTTTKAPPPKSTSQVTTTSTSTTSRPPHCYPIKVKKPDNPQSLSTKSKPF